MQKNEIVAVYGTDIGPMVQKLLDYAGLESIIGSREKHIGLKPNLVVARPADEGATTHPEISAAVLHYLRGHGFRNLSIIEGAWVGEKTGHAFSACGYTHVAKETGATLVDTQRDSHHTHNCAGMDIDICDSALAVDFMINLPVMKGHCQTKVTCALKNNKGILTNAEKRRFHTMGLHKPIACLNTVAKNDFILVDGICGDLDFEEGGNPLPTNRMFAALDPVLCDAYAAAQMGFEPGEIGYLPLAAALGVGSLDLAGAKITELNGSQEAGVANPAPAAKVKRLAPYIDARSACSACYAAAVRALSLAEGKTLAGLENTPLCVGQDFKGQTGTLGAGACTAKFSQTVPGCPARAVDILRMLRGEGQ